jgi:predicted AlkP superfamily phosphohydrolase/phosphomutase
MSDHGFQGKEKSVNVNLALREWGLLHVSGMGTMAARGGFRRLARSIKKMTPKPFYRRAKSVVHARVDWSKTKAFAAPNPQQGIYINLKGREPHGVVESSEYEAVRDEIIKQFKTLVDPDDGKPVLDAIHKREDVLHGAAAADAPDLFPICRQYSYELSDGLYSPSVLTDYRDLPRGFHHMDGIFGIFGPGVQSRSGLTATLYDIAPTALYVAGQKVPETDGRVLDEGGELATVAEALGAKRASSRDCSKIRM